MLDINDLEKRWLHYKIKSYIPHAIITVSLIVISTILFFIIPSEVPTEKKVTTTKVIPKQIQKKPIIKQTATTQVVTQPIIKKEKKIVPISIETNKKHALKLEPSLNFMNKMQNASQPYYNNSNAQDKHRIMITPNTDSFKKPVQKAPIVKEEVIEQEIEVVEDEEVIEPAHKISIKRRNTKDDIAEIIKRFKKNNNPALSLFVAKKYYELGDYQQSYNYALITNNINSDIEQSWIIFAKSLVKLNEKEMAIKTLKSYIKSSHSNSAQILLEEITSGKFQ